MDSQRRDPHGVITRSATGPSAAETFTIIAIATILLTRLFLQLTGYPQVGGGDLHIAHALYGGALMMLALLIGWLMLGFGARMACVVLGGIGFGLFLDEVGKFVTKDQRLLLRPRRRDHVHPRGGHPGRRANRPGLPAAQRPGMPGVGGDDRV